MADHGETYQSIWRDLMQVAFKQDYVEAGGLRTRYAQAGSPSSPPLVMLHGTGGHWETFCRNLGPLSRQFNCFALDMMGCGFTDKPDKPYEIADYVEHAMAFMDKMGIGKASFIGVSLGSWVITRLALAHPEKVEKMILIAPPGLLPLPESSKSALDVRRSTAADPSWEKIGKVLGNLYFDKKSLMDDMIAVRQQVYSLPNIQKIMPRMLTLFDPEIRERNNLSEGQWRSIKTPTLVIAHVDHPDLYLNTANAIVKLLPNVKRVEMTKTSHWPQFEDATTFNDVALEFLTN